jgi:hypothetical protein
MEAKEEACKASPIIIPGFIWGAGIYHLKNPERVARFS